MELSGPRIFATTSKGNFPFLSERKVRPLEQRFWIEFDTPKSPVLPLGYAMPSAGSYGFSRNENNPNLFPHAMIMGIHPESEIDVKSDLAKNLPLLREKLAGKVLVDLGCGMGMSVRIALKFAAACGVAHYVGIDLGHQEYFKDGKAFVSSHMPSGMEITLFQEDMLEFAKCLLDGSVNVLINGIYPEIIRDRKYQMALSQEIARVVYKGGVVFGDSPPFLEPFHKMEGWKDSIQQSSPPFPSTVKIFVREG
jgi:SAM-dependent methyltransferase